jgi:molybdopterin-containing oxidoreductase family iron-sulfur binding subunit
MPPEANDERLSDPRLWQGLESYMDSPEFKASMESEFPEDAAEWTDPVSRRNFMGLMGASLALAGAAGCSPRPAPVRKIVPYTTQPDQLTPGVPLYFASAAPLGGYVSGVIVRSNEGRPTKIEGNPDHPSSLGGTGVHEQASILDLYDPDRSATPTHNGSPVTYEAVITALRKELDRIRKSGDKGKKFRLLSGTVTSPTLAAKIVELLNDFPEARWVQHEPCGQDGIAAGTKKAFGRELNVVYDFAKADVILSLDADFLGEGPGHVRYSRDFATRRRIRTKIPAGQENQYVAAKADEHNPKIKTMSRLYVVEAMPSVTGSVADHRLPVPASQVDAFARAIAAKVGVPGVSATGSLPGDSPKWIEPLANDLKLAKGKCIVIAGDCQPPQVHALAFAMNQALGNIGSTVQLIEPVEAKPAGKVIDLATLVKEMSAKQIDTLFLLGGANPAYTNPADVDFAAAVKNVKFTFHLGSHQDETAALCEWHINESHYLETWGDGRGHDGTVGLQQPLIAPLYAGKSALEVIVDLFPTAPTHDARELVRATWKKWFADTKQAGEFELFWQEAVRSGVVKGTAAAAAKATVVGNLELGVPSAAPTGTDLEINFRADPSLYDGRYANNGWLQELPKPVTRVTWDNAAYVSLDTFKRIQAEKFPRWIAGERGRMEVSVVELDYKGKKIKLPIWPLPGHPDNVVTVHLGFGRERAGRVGNQDNSITSKTVIGVSPDILNAEGKAVRGSNAYTLRTNDAPWFAAGLKMAKTGGDYFLACLQSYWSMEGTKDPLSGHPIKRDPVRHGTVSKYSENPWFAKIPPAASGETGAISHNVPGPVGESEKESGTQLRHGTEYGPGHDHDDKGGHHDKRIFPLTMYHPNDDLYPGLKPEQQRRWGMTFDLSACHGCNACMIACVSENNTPVVGKREVTRGHDMFWIRIDRYYGGSQDAPTPDTYFQPVPCQQCEKAPCETVCPVGATTHTSDGLNDMAYNRCVGTRYCSNNCPYKVRRFNFLTFQDWTTESIKLGRNPDVTVRSRGVMEKCTYCVQRIRFGEIVAEREARPIKDGEVRTACQSACPSGAISFGDMNDKVAQIGQWKGEPSNYGLLAELNTMPRTTYLASIRNPNPELKQS